MSKACRNDPRRSTASESRYALFEFDQEFPDDAACLDYLVMTLYPDGIFCPTCKKVTKHYREAARPSYACEYCGHHEHPMVGTIFENSATSLRLWFYAIYLMSSTRCGISAKQLERELGVTYKTAWRMFNKIRSLLADDEAETFNGAVEADEAYMGGPSKWHKAMQGRGRGPRGKTPVVGLAQRRTAGKHGKVYAKVVDSPGTAELLPRLRKKVLPASTIYTDEWRAYEKVGTMGYRHSRVHHAQQVYVDGDAHTNTIDGFWSLLKRGISGVYHSVSDKHLQSYLDEYTFRYNHREADGRGMFSAFLDRVEKEPRE
jgi:transposase